MQMPGNILKNCQKPEFHILYKQTPTLTPTPVVSEKPKLLALISHTLWQ